YREPDREKGRDLMSKLIDSVSHGVLAASARSPHWAGRSESALPTCSPTSTGPAHPTAPPRRSTAGSNTCGAPPSDSATSPTTSPDPCSRPAASDPDYTLDREEPDSGAVPRPACAAVPAGSPGGHLAEV